MRFWSEGLGDRELIIGLDKAELTQKPDCLELGGVVDSPAPWEYEIKMEVKDWQAILKTASEAQAGAFIVKYATVAQMAEIVASLARFIVLLSAYRISKVARMGSVKPSVPDALPRSTRENQ